MARSLKISLYILSAFIIFVGSGIVAMIVMVGGGFSEPSIDEVLRITSPNQKLDAVFISENYHSTVPYVGKLFIVLRSHSVQNEEEYLRITNFDNIFLSWQDNTHLNVEYSDGMIHNFLNIYKLPNTYKNKFYNLDNQDTNIEIILNKIKK